MKFYSDDWLTIYQGDVRDVLPTLPADSVDCIVTSPPYWMQRDYGVAEQIGMEDTPEQYVVVMVGVIRELRRVLKPDGALWLNVGDTYAASGKGGGGNRGDRKAWRSIAGRNGFRSPAPGYKPKDLTLTPFQLAIALREDGWYFRGVHIWEKPAAVEPERLDRPSVSHEYVFLLTKSEHYQTRNPGANWWHHSVWSLKTDADASHMAMMPSELASRCISSSSPVGGVVLDPFAGSGTTGMVANRLSRRAILVDLNGDYLKQQLQRNAQTPLGLGAA